MANNINFDLLLNDKKFQKSLLDAVSSVRKVEKSFDRVIKRQSQMRTSAGKAAKGVNLITQAASRASSNVKKLNINLKNAAQTGKSIAGAADSLNKVSKAANKASKSIKSVGRARSKSFSAGKIVKFGAALLGVQTASLALRKGFQLVGREITGSIKKFAKFEKSMLAVRGLLDKTSFASGNVSEGFQKMGRDLTRVLQEIPIDAQDATKAIFDITSAQISAADATGVLTAAGKLAVAGNASVKSTTDALIKSIKAYNLNADEAGSVAAKFFTAQKLGLTTVEELSKGFGLVASQAARMGISLDEVLGSVVGTTRGAIGTRRAFVGLSAAFKSILKPSEDAKRAAKEFNIELGEKGIKSAGGFINFLKNMDSAVGGSTTQLNRFFGSARGLKQILALLSKEGIKGAEDSVRAMGDEVGVQKTLNDAYGNSVKGLSSQWDLFTNNTDEVRKGLVSGLAPAFKDVLTKATKSMSDLFKEIQKPQAQKSIAALGDSIVILAESLLSLSPAFESTLKFFTKAVQLATEAANQLDGATSSATVNTTKQAKEAEKLLGLMQRRADIESGRERTIGLTKKQALIILDRTIATVKARVDEGIAVIKVNQKLKNTQDLNSNIASIRIKDRKIIAKEDQKAARKAIKDIRKQQEEAKILKAQKAKTAAQSRAILERANRLLVANFKTAKASAVDLGKTEIDLIRESSQKRQIAIAKGVDLFIKASKLKGKASKQALLDAAGAIAKIEIDSSKKIEAIKKRIREEGLSEKLKAELEQAQKEEKIARDSANRKAKILAGIGSAASTLKVGSDSQKSVREAKDNLVSAQNKARTSVKFSDTAAKSGVSRGSKNVADLEAAIKKLSAEMSSLNSDGLVGSARVASDANNKSILDSKSQQKSDLREQLKIAKKKLSEDRQGLKSILKSNKDSAGNIAKAIEDVKVASKGVDAAVAARDANAQGILIDGASGAASAIAETVAGDIAGPIIGEAVGAAAGPLLQLLTGSPEDLKAFIEAIANQVPVLIDTLVTNLPVLIVALVDAVPKIIQALVDSAPDLIIALVNSMDTLVSELIKQAPTIAVALADAMPTVAIALAQAVVDSFKEKAGIKAGDSTGSAVKKGLKTAILGDQKFSPTGFNLKKILGDLGVPAATGGIITGAGNRDTVPAMLTPGELVIDRTTGPRLNKFLDSVQASPSGAQDTGGGDAAMLAQILSEVRKPIQVTAEAKVNEDAFADIVLNLNRQNARLA